MMCDVPSMAVFCKESIECCVVVVVVVVIIIIIIIIIIISPRSRREWTCFFVRSCTVVVCIWY
jgi:hypothetical protein